MTPLAKALAEAAVSNPKWWRSSGNEKLLAPFPHDVKCFEVTAVMELADELGRQACERGNVVESLAFLPAPVTWLEYRYTREDGTPAVNGYLLVDQGNNTATVASTIGLEINGRTTFIPIPLASLRLLNEADPDGWAIDSILEHEGVDVETYAKKIWHGLYPPLRNGVHPPPEEHDPDRQLDDAQERAWWLYAMLSLINSPRIVARSDHKPSSGLQKFLNRKGDGQYNLLPWHEVFLDITPPPEATEAAGAPRLTGPRALHFCRQHIRIKRGKLELVRAHYRGSADVGIAQTQYRVGSA